MSDSGQTDSNDPALGVLDSQSSASGAATESGVPKEAIALRFLGWLGVSVLLALLVGLMFSTLTARFRLIGLMGIIQGAAVGAAIGQAGRPFKLHYAKLAAMGGFVAGGISVAVTVTLWWQAWAKQLDQSVKPRPDAAIAAQMLAQMKKPESSDPEQLKTYEESRRQFSEFLDSQTSSSDNNFLAWLTHRTSILKIGSNKAAAVGLLEFLLACGASALIARGMARSPFCLQCQNWRSIVRSHSFSAPLPEPLKITVKDGELNSITSATVELSTCGCEQRPLVNIQWSSRNSVRQIADIDLSDQQFLDLKRLLDEAQGMN